MHILQKFNFEETFMPEEKKFLPNLFAKGNIWFVFVKALVSSKESKLKQPSITSKPQLVEDRFKKTSQTW